MGAIYLVENSDLTGRRLYIINIKVNKFLLTHAMIKTAFFACIFGTMAQAVHLEAGNESLALMTP